jgi:ribonucleoside-diphosphate reductase beta chain
MDHAFGEGRSYRYFRNGVERHWDPGGIDLSADRERLADLGDAAFDQLRTTLALFGAGEEAVTEELAPLAVVLSDPNDQAFVAAQTYEEAKHADFFARYWREVVDPAARERGLDAVPPTDDRWFPPEYVDLFDRVETAMERLLDDDGPEARARAYAHYHLTVEGILAQTGYYGVQSVFSGERESVPELPGLVAGFSKIRADEGRHVGFGMAELKSLIADGADPAVVGDTVGELLPLVQATVEFAAGDDDDLALDPAELAAYAADRHVDRMSQLTDDADLPDVEELVAVDDPGTDLVGDD